MYQCWPSSYPIFPWPSEKYWFSLLLLRGSSLSASKGLKFVQLKTEANIVSRCQTWLDTIGPGKTKRWCGVLSEVCP